MDNKKNSTVMYKTKHSIPFSRFPWYIISNWCIFLESGRHL